MILVDSHVVLWMAFAPRHLSRRAAEELVAAKQRNEPLAIAAPTLYEFALVVAYKRIETTESLDFLVEELTSRFAVLPLTPEIAKAAATMPVGFPRDPFDRLITATAIVNGLALVTADGLIRKANVVATIW